MKQYPIIRISDIFEALNTGEHTHFAHGCNCQKSLARQDGGGGIAALVAEWCPEAVEADKQAFANVGAFSQTFKTIEGFGSNVDNEVIVYNLYTQFNPGPSTPLSLHPAIWESLSAIKEHLMDSSESLAIPAIGCGIAGGSISMLVGIIQQLNIPNLYLYLHPSNKDMIHELMSGGYRMARFEEGYGLLKVTRDQTHNEPRFNDVHPELRFTSINQLRNFVANHFGRIFADLPNFIVDLKYTSQLTTEQNNNG